MSCRQILSEDFQGSWSCRDGARTHPCTHPVIMKMSLNPLHSAPAVNLALSQERLPAGMDRLV